MKHSKKVEEEVLLQYFIKEEKNKLQNNIALYRKYLFKQNNSEYTENEILEANKLYGTVIGLLFKNFYGCNSSDLKDVLRKEYKVKIPENDVLYIMDNNHLKYYHTMLQAMNKFFDKNPDTSIEIIRKIATTISVVAYDDFAEVHGTKPFDNLVKSIQETNNKKTIYSQMTLEEITKKPKQR